MIRSWGRAWGALLAVVSAVALTLLAGPATALAAPSAPGVTASQVTSTSGTTVEVDATVNPEGQATTYEAEYDLASSAWCDEALDGSPTPPSDTSPVSLPETDSSAHSVSVDVTGLTPGAQYCAVISATNATGTGMSPTPAEFTVGLPSATSTLVDATSATASTLYGDVNPVGQPTTYVANYDLGSSTWCMSLMNQGSPTYTTVAASVPVDDNTSHAVAVDITGLTPGTAYCAEVVATNGSGSTPSLYRVAFAAGAPGVQGVTLTPTGPTTAEVQGDIDPAGQATSYRVEYDTSSSAFCTAGGTPANVTPSQSLIDTDVTDHSVTVMLTGLTAGAAECAELVATNASSSDVPPGLPQDPLVRFTAGTPSTQTDGADPTGASTATVGGFVDPAGQATTYLVGYDVAGSSWCGNGFGAPTYSSAAQALSATDDAEHQVSVELTGLEAGTTYCAQIIATNASGTSATSSSTFVVGPPPSVTFAAGGPGTVQGTIGSGAAGSETLSGIVAPNGLDTTYAFAYAPDRSSACEIGDSSDFTLTATTDAGSGFGPVSASATLTGLNTVPGLNQYCWALTATNADGTSTTAIGTFTLGATPDGGAPAVTAVSQNTASATSETLTGTVDPEGYTTTYQFEYAPSSSAWCSSDGASSTPTSTASAGAGDGGAPSTVTATATGLSAGTTYCWALSATNSAGTTLSAQATFATAAATTTTSTSTTTSMPTPTSPAAITTPTTTTTTKPARLACTLRLDSGVVRLPAHGRKKTARARGATGVLTLTARCDQSARGTLAGIIAEQMSDKGPAKPTGKLFKVDKTFALQANRSATVTVKLPAKLLTGLAAKHRTTAAFVLSAKNTAAAGTAAVGSTALRGQS
jgi:hypothetical protein